jgi:hypothetical protein
MKTGIILGLEERQHTQDWHQENMFLVLKALIMMVTGTHQSKPSESL